MANSISYAEARNRYGGALPGQIYEPRPEPFGLPQSALHPDRYYTRLSWAEARELHLRYWVEPEKTGLDHFFTAFPGGLVAKTARKALGKHFLDYMGLDEDLDNLPESEVRENWERVVELFGEGVVVPPNRVNELGLEGGYIEPPANDDWDEESAEFVGPPEEFFEHDALKQSTDSAADFSFQGLNVEQGAGDATGAKQTSDSSVDAGTSEQSMNMQPDFSRSRLSSIETPGQPTFAFNPHTDHEQDLQSQSVAEHREPNDFYSPEPDQSQQSMTLHDDAPDAGGDRPGLEGTSGQATGSADLDVRSMMPETGDFFSAEDLAAAASMSNVELEGSPLNQIGDSELTAFDADSSGVDNDLDEIPSQLDLNRPEDFEAPEPPMSGFS